MVDIDRGKVATDIAKYAVTAIGALMLFEAITNIEIVKFKMDNLQKAMVGAPLFSTGLMFIALTRGGK